jgi:hypothetical protein
MRIIDQRGLSVTRAGAVWLAALLCALGKPAGAAQDDAELTQEIVLRCIYDIGEFGEAAVQECMRSERAAAQALEQYPPEVKPIVDRCRERYGVRGYGMTDRCVKRELAAGAAEKPREAR